MFVLAFHSAVAVQHRLHVQLPVVCLPQLNAIHPSGDAWALALEMTFFVCSVAHIGGRCIQREHTSLFGSWSSWCPPLAYRWSRRSHVQEKVAMHLQRQPLNQPKIRIQTPRNRIAELLKWLPPAIFSCTTSMFTQRECSFWDWPVVGLQVDSFAEQNGSVHWSGSLGRGDLKLRSKTYPKVRLTENPPVSEGLGSVLI